MLSRSRINISMGTASFHELKKQASFFFKDTIKTARLALTDVTSVQLMTEEATDGESWTPNTKTLSSISKAAYEREHYLGIIDVLHKRLEKFEKRNWRMGYNSIIVVEHLLTHGPESVADEFQDHVDVIAQMQAFHHIDDKGFNWGLAVRRKAEKVLKLLENGSLLKDEKRRARELSRGIQGFGSFNYKSSSSLSENGIRIVPPHEIDDWFDWQQEKPKDGFSEESITDLKENMAPEDEDITERDQLLANKKDEGCDLSDEDENHPFVESENKQTDASLLGY